MSAPPTVHLVDALPYVFRAFFSMPDSVTDVDGRPANASRGFLDMLVRYLGAERPEHIAVAFDESLTTCFRNDRFPAYKAQRDLPPEDLLAQLADCRSGAEALGLACFADARYEADDFLATLAKQVVEQGALAVVVTIDKDLCQLVDERVSVYDFARNLRYGPAEVFERFGVRPEQIADYLGLAGDSVDNIPGVKGVGPKTAAALLQHFADVEDLYARLDDVADVPVRGAKSLAAKLEAHREDALLSRWLATVSTEAPAAVTLEALRWHGARARPLAPLLDRLGSTRLTERIQRWDERA